MYKIDEYRHCLERLNAVLRTCGIRFYLTGGAAFIAYGDPRTTQDVDLVVDANSLRNSLPLFLRQATEQQFLLSEQSIRDGLRLDRQFQLIDLAGSLKVDMYPRELVPGSLNRAVEIQILPGIHFPVASLPDLVIAKLVWISKGSSKSRRDLKELMRRLSSDEERTARELAADMQLTALLGEVLAEPDEIDA